MRGRFWYCSACEAQNSSLDGECQFCDCGGIDCKRDNCSAIEHFHGEHQTEGAHADCVLCDVEETAKAPAPAGR